MSDSHPLIYACRKMSRLFVSIVYSLFAFCLVFLHLRSNDTFNICDLRNSLSSYVIKNYQQRFY